MRGKTLGFFLAGYVLFGPTPTAFAAGIASLALSGSAIAGSDQTISGSLSITRAPGEGAVFPSVSSTGGLQTDVPLGPIPAGVDTINFKAFRSTEVLTPTTASLTVCLDGSCQTRQVTFLPFTPTLTLSGSSVTGGSTQPLTATVTLNATVKHGSGWLVVRLTSSPGGILAHSGFSISTGQNQATQTITHPIVGQQKDITLTAEVGPTGSAMVSVLPFTVSISAPSKLSSPDSQTAEVTLNAPVRTGTWVTCWTDPGGAVSFSCGNVSPNQSTANATLSVGTINDPYSTTLKAQVSAGPIGTAAVEVTPKDQFPQCGSGGSSDGCGGEELGAGEPINLANGNVWIEHTDHLLPGLGGGLQLQRTWNSLWQFMAPVETVGHFGYSWRSTYEERLQTKTGGYTKYWLANGESWTFKYDSVNGTYSLIVPENQPAALTASGGVRTLTFRDGSKKNFNAGGYLTSMVDRNGNVTTVNNDASNRITSVVDAASRALTFNYTGASRLVTSIQDSTGVIASYTYGPNSFLTRVTFADGAQLNYDQNNYQSLVTSVKDKDSRVLEAHTYDGNYRGLTSSRALDADKLTVSYTSGSSTRVTDSKGNVSDYGHKYLGGNGKATSISGPGCNSCGGRGLNTYAYDGSGRRTAATNAAAQTTNYTYDTAGNVLNRTVYLDGVAQTWTYTYNGLGQALTATDPLGNVTTNTYDPKGNLLTTTTPPPASGQPASTTAFEYFPNGLLKKITDPRANATHFTYTAAGLLETITDAESNVTTFAYDARGNRTSVTDARNQATTFEYDARSRLKKINHPTSPATFTEYAYDTRGRRTSVTDANGKVTSYAYDDADRLTSVTDAQSPSAGVTQYTYDTENNLTSITDALGRVTTFEYDARGWLTKTTFPSTLYETYTYDAIGNLKTKLDRKANTTTYTYDTLNRLSKKSYQDSSEVNFAYDVLGRRTQATTNYAFLTSRTLTVKSEYDLVGNRVKMTNAENQDTVYVYDSLNRLTKITDFTGQDFDFTYDALGRRTSLNRPGTVPWETTYTYDDLSRLLSIAEKSSGTQYDGWTYAYDNVGNRLSSQRFGQTATSYGYDNIYRLTSASATTFSYDKVGNRTDIGTYNSSNQMLTRGNWNYVHDNNGNRTEANLTGNPSAKETYVWDYENRLTEIKDVSGSAVASYTYDPFGKRIRRGAAGVTEIYVYDGAHVVEDLNAAGSLLRRYSVGSEIDELLAQVDSTTTFLLADALGSIARGQQKDSPPSVASGTYSYEAWGARNSLGSFSTRYGFTGREHDWFATYHRARYYDVTAGRFISEDPARFAGGGQDFYAYVQNLPTGLIDPFGLCPWQINKRPLKGVPGAGPFNLHHYYFYNPQTGQSMGLGPKEGTLRGPVEGVWETNEKAGTHVGEVPDWLCACVDNRIKNPGPPPNYCTFKGKIDVKGKCMNCLGWVGRVLQECYNEEYPTRK